MRKFAILVAAAFGLYSGLWYYQVNQLQTSLQKHLDQYAEDKTYGLSITHDGINKGGFPTFIKLTLVNPKLRLLGEPLYNAEIAVEGSLAADFSLLGRFDSLQLDGKTHIHLPQVEENPAIDGTVEGNFQVGFSQNTAIPGKQVYDVTIDARGVDIQFASQHIYTDKLRILVQELRKQIESKREKTDFQLAFELELPDFETLERVTNSPFTLLTQPVPTFSFVVTKYSQMNKFGNTESSGEITIDENMANNVQLHIASETHLTIHKACHDAMMSAIDEVIQAQSLPAPLQAFLVQHKSELENLIPRFHNLGTIRFDKNLTVTCNKANFDTKILLPKLELLCDLFGIKVHGMGQRVGGEISGELTIDLIKYRTLIESLIHYVNEVIVLCEDDVDPISDNTQALIFAYLKDISNNANDSSDSIEISFRYTDADGAFVGNMPWELFTAKTGELLAAIEQDMMHRVPV